MEKLLVGLYVLFFDLIIVVEGRVDVFNLFKYGIKNVIVVEGILIFEMIIKFSKERIVMVFIDGDCGGEFIFKEFF